MRMIAKLLVMPFLSFPLLLQAAAGPAEGSFVKNGHACFADVCIGDRLEDIAGFSFLPLEELPQYRYDGWARFRSEHREVFGFWDDSFQKALVVRQLDPRIFEVAGQYADVCPDDWAGHPLFEGGLTLTGRYETASGLYTLFEVTLLPDLADPAMPARLFVTRLSRVVLAADEGEAQRIADVAKARYEPYFHGTYPITEGDGLTTLASVETKKHGDHNGVLITLRMRTASRVGARNYSWNLARQADRCTSGVTPSID